VKPDIMRPSLSLIIAVYNKPEILRFVLAACARQSIKNFEVLVADDGSGPAVHEVIDEYRRTAGVHLTHMFHDDRGWRKNTILNSAIRASQSDYLVFIDGDCIPSRRFMEDHWREREEHTVLLGRRVETSKRWSELLTVEAIAGGSFERLNWGVCLDGLRGDALRIEDGIRMPGSLLRKVLLRRVRGMLGSNFSVAKSDLVAINGFDEAYDGPGCGEDSDVQYRLSLIGVKGKSIRNLAIQFHVHHPLTTGSDACWERFERVKRTGQPSCRMGLEHLDGPGTTAKGP
jgi:glycosyltransferase involved in cell wall biosynthesis